MLYKGYSHDHLDALAEDFLGKYAKGKYDGRALRIESLIESYGYTIFQIPGLSEIAEAYVPAKPGYIFVDEEQYLNGASFRWRFTMAEELAHILIHRPLFDGKTIDQIKSMQAKLTDDEYRRIEQDAKYLAGCLLMPKNDFKDRFHHFFNLQAQRSSNFLTIIRYAVRQLNFDFNVSCYSVGLRAFHLGLIDQSQLDDLLQSYA